MLAIVRLMKRGRVFPPPTDGSRRHVAVGDASEALLERSDEVGVLADAYEFWSRDDPCFVERGAEYRAEGERLKRGWRVPVGDAFEALLARLHEVGILADACEFWARADERFVELAERYRAEEGRLTQLAEDELGRRQPPMSREGSRRTAMLAADLWGRPQPAAHVVRRPARRRERTVRRARRSGAQRGRCASGDPSPRPRASRTRQRRACCAGWGSS
jgi:hypothetical protein